MCVIYERVLVLFMWATHVLGVMPDPKPVRPEYPAPRGSEPVWLESPAGAYYQAARDLRALPETHRRRVRYLALYAIPPERRPDFLKALVFHINSLSSRKTFVPIEVVGDGLLARIDLFELGWDRESRRRRTAEAAALGVTFRADDVSEDVWESISYKDPYFRVTGKAQVDGREVIRRGWLDPALEAEVRGLSCSFKAVLRADWFLVATALDRPAGFYSDVMMFPRLEADFNRLLLINEAQVRGQNQTVGGVVKAGVSFVARNPREIELIKTPVGSLWRTYDFSLKNVQFDKDPQGLKNPHRQHRGTVRHDGREVIVRARNALQAFILFNGAGQQVAEVPPDIAYDQRHDETIRERIVTNMWTCVGCHSQEKGYIQFRCAVTDLMQAAPHAGVASIGPDPEQIAINTRLNEDYYSNNFLDTLEDDRADYEAAIGRLNGLSAADNGRNYVNVIQHYVYDPVDRATAAREFGVADENLTRFLQRSNDNDLLLLIDVAPLSRPQFEQAFRAGMNGIEVFPWEIGDEP